MRRRGKHLIVDAGDGLSLLIHLMSAGRLQLYDKRAGPRDRTSRLLVRCPARRRRRELRLREFGSKQAAWVKLLPAGELEQDDALAGLGPEAWPEPPAARRAARRAAAAARAAARPARDRRDRALVGRRDPVDGAPVALQARRRPRRRTSSTTLREAIAATCSARALEHYEKAVALPIPDKLPMPLRVHRHEGEPCPRCGTTLRAVHFEDYVIAYCPDCQTEGRVLKDRRLSRLLR